MKSRIQSILQSAKLVLTAFCLSGVSLTVAAQIGGTEWTVKPVTFHIQWPYDVPQDARYWFTNGIYHCLVCRGDKPFTYGNPTKPRTEQRFTPDYTAGEIQYQADLMMPSNEDSYCVFQIHTGNAQSRKYGSTTFMLFWFRGDGGSLRVYHGKELARSLGDKWFQLNVDHDLVTRMIKVWINRKLVWTQQDNGAGDFYMKDGVYQQGQSPSQTMETSVTKLRMWTSSRRAGELSRAGN